MKKILFALAILASSTSTAFSQGIEWGGKTGMNISLIKDRGSLSAYPGFYAGAFAECRINDSFGVQGELLYSKTLESTSGWDGVKDGKNFFSLDYVVLPIVGKFYPVPNLSFELGSQFGYMLYDEIDRFDKRFDLSVGAGISYKFGRRFDVSVRYNQGVIRLAKNTDDRNNTFRFGAGFRF